jgi:hypothetical protein
MKPSPRIKTLSQKNRLRLLGAASFPNNQTANKIQTTSKRHRAVEKTHNPRGTSSAMRTLTESPERPHRAGWLFLHDKATLEHGSKDPPCRFPSHNSPTPPESPSISHYQPTAAPATTLFVLGSWDYETELFSQS